jgi:hypothetical protein
MNHEYFPVVMEFQIRYIDVGPVFNNANMLIQGISADSERVFPRDPRSGKKFLIVPAVATI